jgi:hypothetical protein
MSRWKNGIKNKQLFFCLVFVSSRVDYSQTYDGCDIECQHNSGKNSIDFLNSFSQAK